VGAVSRIERYKGRFASGSSRPRVSEDVFQAPIRGSPCHDLYGRPGETTVYLIRHGEKPDDGGIGLSIQGEDWAQCLRQVFGASSGYNIGYIMAMTPKDSM
jgi:hypothetical protein